MEKRPHKVDEPQISFESREVEYPDHGDMLVISVRITNALVKRVMVDTGSSVDILYKDAFLKLGLTTTDLSPMNSTLIGFTRDFVVPLGMIVLPITLSQEHQSKTLMVTFMVVGLPTTCNIILGWLTLNRLRAVVSTYHRAMKFPTRAGVREVRSDPRESRRCYLTMVTMLKRPRATLPYHVETTMPSLPFVKPLVDPREVLRQPPGL
ncbi:hypothetical protein B296_00025839 [Ensete ventricosum]|uniref:Aspartic peptidase DDI1-type domain-containing protein n=1 Tax=Ensete ventricosum TaxID=4639 RepID=A0A426ZWI8_ENSVE|nr:hypothetical protein B296_00025839 [Ensete ventricosum]